MYISLVSEQILYGQSLGVIVQHKEMHILFLFYPFRFSCNVSLSRSPLIHQTNLFDFLVLIFRFIFSFSLSLKKNSLFSLFRVWFINLCVCVWVVYVFISCACNHIMFLFRYFFFFFGWKRVPLITMKCRGDKTVFSSKYVEMEMEPARSRFHRLSILCSLQLGCVAIFDGSLYAKACVDLNSSCAINQDSNI